MTTAISVQDMRDQRKLFTLDEARAVLATTEPLGFVPVVPGSGVRFRVEPEWNDRINVMHGTEPLGVSVRLAPSGNLDGPDVAEYSLSKDALLSAIKPFGMSGSYAFKCPPTLLEENLNYWYREGLEKDLQLMVVGHQEIGQAVVKESMVSFSNLSLFDRAVAKLTEQYEADSLYVDVSKLAHSLRRTFLQFVIPAESRRMVESGTQHDDWWWGGVQVQNSLTAESQTRVAGYLFRPICTNGMVDTGPSAGAWSRRAAGSDAEDVYSWAERAVEDALGGLEHTFDLVQATASHGLEGEMGDVVGDVFDQFRLPARSRSRVIDGLVESDDLSMYAVLNAVTQAANDADNPEEAQVLMSTGGDLAQHSERCDSCHRIMT